GPPRDRRLQRPEPRALVRHYRELHRKPCPRPLHGDPAMNMRLLVLLALIAAGASAIERKTQRELLRERGEHIEAEVDEGEDPEARYREQRKMDESPLTDAALLERLRISRRERDRAGASQSIQPMQLSAGQSFSAASPSPAVQGN